MLRKYLLLPLALFAAGACSNPDPLGVAVAPPMELSGSAYEAAADTPLETVRPLDLPGLLHVYHLSGNIISGAEPQGREGLRRVAQLGVRTILSVDGKVPDAAGAAEFGMRYVHVPLQYVGLTDDEILNIAKTFRELEGPFYVHCFHGKHRGPAAAALGRVVLDGVPRDHAIAEMRQWCETSSKYEGLYSTVAAALLPTPAETARHAFDFPAAHRFDGFRSLMIEMTRKWDLVKEAQERGWQIDPEHPDVLPLGEATQLHQLFAATREFAQDPAWSSDFHGWLEEGIDASSRLVRALEASSMAAAEAPGEPGAADWPEQAASAFATLQTNCVACHDAYRN